MATYILRRILLMIPTLFAISFVVFIILNLAPGAPGAQAGAQGQESADESGSKREAFRIFKEQFNLNLPVLLNFRYRLEKKEILLYLKQISRQIKDVSAKEMIEAEDTLEDYGQYAVPHLVAIINSSQNEVIQQLAVSKFRENAKGKQFSKYRDIEGPQAKKLVAEFHKQHSKLAKQKGQKEYQRQLLNYVNREIGKENAKIDKLYYTLDSSKDQKTLIISKINQWYQKHISWYKYSTSDKFWITFFDTRFAHYWANLIHLDFGISHMDKQPVLQKVISKMRYSITLSLTALLLSYFIAIPLGIFSAVKQNSLADRTTSVILFMLYSLPNFFVGTLLLQFFSKGGDYWHIFPTGGFQSINYMQMTTWGQLEDIAIHIVLPIICLSYVGLASLSRYARSGLLDVIRSDYIKTARAKGLPEYLVILRHAVRNGMIPVLTLLASLLPVLISGSIVIEFIFAIDGMGSLTLLAITMKDYNTIMCTTLLSAVLVMLGILFSDISYALVDPRISFK